MATLQDYKAMLKGRSIERASFTKLTTLGVGGEAEFLWLPDTLLELCCGLRELKTSGQTPTIIGGGSNILVRDGGVSGVTLKLGNGFKGIRRQGSTLTVSAATSTAQLAAYCIESGISGLEFVIGIPGVVGGAVMGNAGAADAWIGERVEAIDLVNWQGEELRLEKRELNFKYRRTILPESGVVTRAIFHLTASTPDSVKHACSNLYRRRWATQPLKEKSAGCVFKNPPGGSAGQIIDTLGWKGFSRGAAKVSEKHANFIINTGDATATEVLQLIDLVWCDVRAAAGIDLQREIRIIGVSGSDDWQDRWASDPVDSDLPDSAGLGIDGATSFRTGEGAQQ